MRKLEIGSSRFTQVVVLDDPSHGNACHKYQIVSVPQTSDEDSESFCRINFQEGPILEHGVNGCHQEDLLAIVIDRLKSFQAGPFSCRENALAITKIEEAMHWLNHRTKERQDRKVEGTSQV